MPVALVVIAALVACGDQEVVYAEVDAGAPRDALDIGPCWPDGVRTLSGTASLGTGQRFEPMPETLPLEYLAAGAFVLTVNAQMSGLAPGNPTHILDPTNPRTRIRAFFADTGIPLDRFAHCPSRYGYVPSGDARYELFQGFWLLIERCWRSQDLIGKQIRIELEIWDHIGRYATDVKIVTTAPPTGSYANDDIRKPGCAIQFDGSVTNRAL